MKKLLFLIAVMGMLAGCGQHGSVTPSTAGGYGEAATSAAALTESSGMSELASQEYTAPVALTVDLYHDSQYSNSVNIYDSDYLHLVLGEERDISLEDFSAVIDSNDDIPEKYKTLVKRYCSDFINKQADAERRILYHNLKTLVIHECEDQNEMDLLTFSYGLTVACYIRDRNAVYVMKNDEFEEGTWDFQVLYHELSHAARSIWKEQDGKGIRIQFSGLHFSSSVMEEALNSLFAVSLFDYEERDIAYQLQSNIIKILVEQMDNYELSDYMNHSASYFVSKLDECHGDINYASTIMKLIERQFDEYHHYASKAEPEMYYPIYRYVSDFYYKNRLSPTVDYEEAKRVTDELVDSVCFDVPDGYNIDKSYFYEYLTEYLATTPTTEAPDTKASTTEAPDTKASTTEAPP